MTKNIKGKRVLVIDNYDSFTYNLVQFLGELGCELSVHRNDRISVDEIAEHDPQYIVISPGPGTPDDSGVTRDLIREFTGKKPILGICLGMQTIGDVYGAAVVRAPELRHGKTSPIKHQNDYLFKDIPSPFEATRYHSLIVEKASINDKLEVTASSDDDLIMGLKVKNTETMGVQFHPESIKTEHGKKLLENFLCYGN